MTCLRCDGTGKYRNEFGLMEKCESCQDTDMTFEKVYAEPNSDEEGYWEKREIIWWSTYLPFFLNQNFN